MTDFRGTRGGMFDTATRNGLEHDFRGTVPRTGGSNARIHRRLVCNWTRCLDRASGGTWSGHVPRHRIACLGGVLIMTIRKHGGLVFWRDPRALVETAYSGALGIKFCDAQTGKDS